MKWFIYTQNNSGGYWTEPAMAIAVEAEDSIAADEIAAANGVDEDAPHCSCCGTRWSMYSDEWDVAKEGDVHKHYALDTEGDSFRASYRKNRPDMAHIPQAILIHADGRREVVL